MTFDVFVGVLLPLLGTALGAACVFFMKKTLGRRTQSILSGFAAGVMVAASIWSLLIPAIEASAHMGVFSFVPATVGFWCGILFLLALDHLVPHLNRSYSESEGLTSPFGKRTKMVLAVTLHNIPEGMAVGAAYAGYLAGNLEITAMSAFALSMGIAIQNFPEGAILSMPLRAEGVKKGRAFGYGLLSGVVEPIFALLTILFSALIVPLLAYFLSFAAGAMLYVVVEELVTEAVSDNNADTGTLFFALGFSFMMLLDVALG
ncbi:MAG: ZIP family metal transporter [Ruminococcaceae bacterium]|nr:ZIP family metal transporter [Oscillospiraceae bacterium]